MRESAGSAAQTSTSKRTSSGLWVYRGGGGGELDTGQGGGGGGNPVQNSISIKLYNLLTATFSCTNCDEKDGGGSGRS